MNPSRAIGVLVPTHGSKPQSPPEQRPIGRAALLLAEEGIDVIFGDRLRNGHISGFRVRPGQWEAAVDVPLNGIHDRFPSQLRSVRVNELMNERNGVPMANPLAFTLWCRDKLTCQRDLEDIGITMPAVTGDPDRFEASLAEWSHGFLKPRYGALGIGVHRASLGDELPHHLEGVVPGRPDPAILQAAVEPPPGWASRTVRVLLQRTVDGGWIQGCPVVRQSRSDFVANAAQGAEVVSGATALTDACRSMIHTAVAELADAFDQLPVARRMVEAGIDLALDPDLKPWIIEINSRPRGRLEVLARSDPSRFAKAHIEACARPIRVLAHGWSED